MSEENTNVTDLSQLLDMHRRALLGRVHTGMIARVTAYDASTQTCTALPLTNQTTNIGEVIEYKPIANIAVASMGGAGFGASCPLDEGDSVFLIFGERSLDEWRGGVNGAYTARNARRFDLSDAIAIPLRSPARPLQSASDSKIVIGVDNETGARVEIWANNKISIGTSAAELLGLFDQLLGAIDTFTTATALATTESTLAPAATTLKASAAAIRLTLSEILS